MSATLTEDASPQDVAAALAAAVTADADPTPVAPVAPVVPDPVTPDPAANQPVADTPATPEVPGTPTPDAPAADDDSLLRAADINLDGLTDDAKAWLTAREREMQSVMTKRTQEAAATLKQYEGLDSPDEARAALAFYKGIQTDPNYAAEVYDFLTQNLTAAGYSPAQAAAKALETMGAEPETPSAPAPAAFGDDPDEAINQRLAQLDESQRRIDARIAAAENREQEALLVNKILQQDSAIRQANPTLTDEQMDYVYQLAEATGGDLFKAHETFSTLREDAIRSYVAQKETVDSPAPPATPPASIVQTPKTLDEGYRMGLERLRQELAANS